MGIPEVVDAFFDRAEKKGSQPKRTEIIRVLGHQKNTRLGVVSKGDALIHRIQNIKTTVVAASQSVSDG
jgi:hypothetical protein